MAAKRTEMDSAELLKHLRDAINNQADDIPEGWKTSKQYAKEWGISANAASIILRRSVDLGKVECKRFRIPTDGRGNYPTQHYKPCNIEVK